MEQNFLSKRAIKTTKKEVIYSNIDKALILMLKTLNTRKLE